MPLLAEAWLVDDDPLVHVMHRHQLLTHKLAETVHIFPDGAPALAALEAVLGNQRPSPALILLDINMPEVNGWTFLERYAHLEPLLAPRPAIFLLTSSLDDADQLRAADFSTVEGYFTKPFREAYARRIRTHFAAPDPSRR